MSKTIQFLTQGITHINETGTIFPCSKYVGKAMAKLMPLQRGETIIELGAGTGAITKELLKNLDKNQRLLCFEINETFCEILKKIADKRIRVIKDNAGNFPRYLERKTQCVISTLPIAIFSREEKNNLLSSIKESLSYKGKFIQFQYSLKDYMIIKKHFARTEIKFIPLNILPGFIYICTNSVA
ncbi:MAG: methyltransferase domain-containing protein [Nanoarchaeota archaeon]